MLHPCHNDESHQLIWWRTANPHHSSLQHIVLGQRAITFCLVLSVPSSKFVISISSISCNFQSLDFVAMRFHPQVSPDFVGWMVKFPSFRSWNHSYLIIFNQDKNMDSQKTTQLNPSKGHTLSGPQLDLHTTSFQLSHHRPHSGEFSWFFGGDLGIAPTNHTKPSHLGIELRQSVELPRLLLTLAGHW